MAKSTSKRGLATLPAARRQAIARKGAKALAKTGKRRAFKKGKEAKALGRKGGKTTQKRNRQARRRALVEKHTTPATAPAAAQPDPQTAAMRGALSEERPDIVGKCFNCGTDVDHEAYCYGCAAYVCDDCDERGPELPPGGHDPNDHLATADSDVEH